MARQQCWLVKSEPNAFSFDDLWRSHARTAEWDGVRNFQARNYMRDDMKRGDRVLFYHSNVPEPAIVGTAVVAREGYPDFTAWDPKDKHYDPKSTPDRPLWYMVDIRAERRFKRLVTLEEIKVTPGLEKMMLVKRGRLSVQPVTPQEFDIIVRLGMGRK